MRPMGSYKSKQRDYDVRNPFEEASRRQYAEDKRLSRQAFEETLNSTKQGRKGKK